jgi:spore coat protein U-like protein
MLLQMPSLLEAVCSSKVETYILAVQPVWVQCTHWHSRACMQNCAGTLLFGPHADLHPATAQSAGSCVQDAAKIYCCCKL